MGSVNEASIAMKVTENLSTAIVGIRNSMTPFRADLGALQGELDKLNATKVSLKVEAEKAKQELKEAKRAFNEMDDAAKDDSGMREAQEKYEAIAEKLRLVSKQANQTERDMLNAGDAISKADNRAEKAGGAGVLGALSSAGLTKLLGDSLSQAGGAAIGSMFGSEGGAMVSSLLSGVTSGAAMGAIAGPAGAAIGAAIGGVSGLISGGTQVFQQRDEAFKSYVQDQYSTVTQGAAAMISSGSTLAAQREMDQIAFTKLLGGEGTASRYLADVRDMANHTPFIYSDLTAMSKTLAPAFGSDPERMLTLMNAIGNAGASVGLGVSDMQMVGTAISRMESTGKTSLEYLNILQERGIDAYGFLSKGLGKSKEEMLEMVSKGLIPGAEAARMIQEGMEGAYEGAMELQSLTFSGLSSTVEGLRQEIEAVAGSAYNEARKPALDRQIAAMSGESGGYMQEAAEAIGAWQAELDNLKDDAVLQRVQDLMMGVGEDGKAYLTAKSQGNAQEMGRLVMLAQVQGMNDFNSSPEARSAMEANVALAEAIQKDPTTMDAYQMAGYNLGVQFSKGMGAAMEDEVEDVLRNALAQSDYMGAPSRPWGTLPGHAAGLNRVPYDNYLALLHQGERVQTAAEARAADQGGGVTVSFAGAVFEIRQEGDAYTLAQELAEAIERKRMAGVVTP